ncbi:MAG: hypothetical protein K2L55_01725 [Muribaculaceae bacterium]|nr:hypothetical protein [Muribaculaceae bacterium]
MEKITYGAPRLVDWVAQIKAGAATVRVHFTGGALTSYGVTPAEYTTANPFIQKVIEQSSYFKEGRIVLLRRAQSANPPMAAKPTKAKSKQQAELKAAPEGPETERVSAATEAPVAAEVDSEAPEQAPEVKSEENGAEAAAGNLTVVEVGCLQDAQAYLQENFNISSYKVRTYDVAQRAAAEHGVRFVGAKFGVADGNAATEEETAEGE